ncbi:MAG: LysM peptidoglycan-binding domain-containing protein [Elusimicrobia bacterium]|nr:LysM peptidoglycan-binding domain-containing protein [Elusimicrobiota bacterium]
MKRFIFAALLCALCGGLNAQQAQPLKIELAADKSKAGVAVSSAPAGPEVKPAINLSTAAVKAETEPAAARVGPVAAAAKPETGGGLTVNKRHIVVRGDTLWDLSRKYYGDPFKWGKLYNANRNSISNPDLIYPKNKLEIPDLTENLIIGEDETLKEPELRSSEIIAAEEASSPANPDAVTTGAQTKPLPQPAEKLEELFKDGDLSEDMPQGQKEWSSGVKIVGDNWREDGVITAKAASNNEMEDSFSLSGETVLVGLRSKDSVKKGDYLDAYLKGASAYDKKGKRLGFELQRAGMLEVLSVDGSRVNAKVLDASTPIRKGLLVKKK